MQSPREGSPARRRALWAALAVGGLFPAVGCQVEYAGMTLPSGKYMRDDVQYFPPGPNFPWANTQAATQRAHMQALGQNVNDLPLPGQDASPVLAQPPAGGALDPTQQRGGRPANLNSGGLDAEPAAGVVPPAPAPDGAIPAPGMVAPGNPNP